MKKSDFLKQFDDIKALPSLPAIVMKVNEMLDNPYTDIDSLSAVIEKDQAIVSKMLAMVNSAFFGLREEVVSVNQACIILGFDAIRNIVVTLSTFKALNNVAEAKPCAKFNVETFWKHSIGVAVLSKHLSKISKRGDPEKCFVAGILHDMGKLMMAYYFESDFEKIHDLAKKKKLIYLDAEKKVAPAFHHEIGYFLAKKWELPNHLANIIYSHHKIQIGSSSFEEDIIVNTADGIINSYISDALNSNNNPGHLIGRYFEPGAHKKMRLWIESASDWFPEVKITITEACSFFMD